MSKVYGEAGQAYFGGDLQEGIVNCWPAAIGTLPPAVGTVVGGRAKH